MSGQREFKQRLQSSDQTNHLRPKGLDQHGVNNENGRNQPYRYLLLSGAELSEFPSAINEIRAMIIAQPEDRLHRRYPKVFKFHHPVDLLRPERRETRSERQARAKTTLAEAVIEDLQSPETEHILLVYDMQGKLAVLADSKYDETDRERKTLEVSIIRAEGSQSLPEGPSLTDFALNTIYEASLKTPGVEAVISYVHRNNDRSRTALYKTLARFEERGHSVGFQDGISDSYDERFQVTRNGHWREYKVRRLQLED